ncbi:MAG: PaaI family thioesterase [Alphaproteobacteria bacterium]|nr:MAG: PaaI family thioesterase [Alphaproteobacteria bacterium]
MPEAFDLDQIQAMIDKGIPHCAEIGMKVHEMSPDGVVFSLPYQERFAGNPVNGVLHGGIITTLIDSAAGMCIFAKLKEYMPVATLDLRIDYLKPATPDEELFAFLTCYRMTRKIAFVRGVAYHETRDDPIANAVGTFMLQSSPTPKVRQFEKGKGA